MAYKFDEHSDSLAYFKPSGVLWLQILLIPTLSKINEVLRGYYTPDLKLAVFVCYLIIIDSFLKNNVCISKLYKEFKNGIESLVGQAFWGIWIKTVKILFWSLTQELLGLLKGIVSDSNNIFLWHESEDINKKMVISKISVDSNYMFSSYA